MSLQDSTIKQQIIDHVYKMVNISNQRFKVLKNVDDIQQVKTKKYYISANCVGNNSLLIFMKIKDEKYSFYIDRRSISHDRKYVKITDVKIVPINYEVDESLYDGNGTIIDGVILDNGTLQCGSVGSFLITDVFVIYGQNVVNVNYKQKMRMILPIFSSTLSTNNIEIIILTVFDINQIKEMSETYVRTNQRKLNIKGYILFPEFSGEKLIYILQREDEKTKHEIIGQKTVVATEAVKTKAVASTIINGEEIDNEHVTKLTYELADSEITEKIILCFEMHKTCKPDVYNLYAIKGNIKTFIDIAYINTYRLSLETKNLFGENEIINVWCIYNSYRKKWTPVKRGGEGESIVEIDKDKRLQLSIT